MFENSDDWVRVVEVVGVAIANRDHLPMLEQVLQVGEDMGRKCLASLVLGYGNKNPILGLWKVRSIPEDKYEPSGDMNIT